MALQPISQPKVNRIVQNIADAVMIDIDKLDKNGYSFLCLCSGFIAHYDVNRFKAHYGTSSTLIKDIMDNRKNNQWENFREGEKDYNYMMQKRDIYNWICEIIEGTRKTPKELGKEIFSPPSVLEGILVEGGDGSKYIEKETFDKIVKDLKHYFACGTNFGVSASSWDRIADIADAIMYFRKHVNEDGEDENTVFNLELEFRSGGKGTISNLINCYHYSLWGIFNMYTGRDEGESEFDDEYNEISDEPIEEIDITDNEPNGQPTDEQLVLDIRDEHVHSDDDEHMITNSNQEIGEVKDV